MVTLYNVIDTRTGKFHSEVIVKQRMVRFFVPAEEEEDVRAGRSASGAGYDGERRRERL